jgi:hypothetical protein
MPMPMLMPMPADPTDTPGPSAMHDQMSQLLQDLDAQIARLAHATGISLDDREGLREALRLQPGSADDSQAERRHQRAHLELRGLLVLRYDVIRKFTEQIGAEATRDLLVEAEGHLDAIGFAHGSDGLHLDTLLGPA